MEIYHIFNKSIENSTIFKNDRDYERFIKAIKFYSYNYKIKFSRFLRLKEPIILQKEKSKIEIIAYCIMPTHFHLIITNLYSDEKIVSTYEKNLMDSYTRYFNTKYKRKGPLWQSRTKKIYIEKDEYLLHLTRYIHLNPVTAGLVEKPEDWKYSSYYEYISGNENLCNYKKYFPQRYNFSKTYKEFVNDRINYQKELAKIKKIIKE